MQAVVVACDICSSNLMLAPLKLISQTTERLRDKKVRAVELVCLMKDKIHNF